MHLVDHPENEVVRLWLQSRAPDSEAFRPAADADRSALRTARDLTDQLWDRCGGELPADCALVVHDHAVLGRPDSGLLFAVAVGTGILALRLPPEALAASEVGPRYGRSHVGVPADDFGEGWMIVPPFADLAPVWCLRAYGLAAAVEAPQEGADPEPDADP